MSALWLYLRFPSLQLDLLYQDETEQSNNNNLPPLATERAICLIDNQKLQVCQLNHAARQAGICQGHSISMACALAADVQLLPYQPNLEQDQLIQLASQLYLHCADIVLDAPAALWLRVDPMLQLYGGLAPFLLLLRQQFPTLHILLGAGNTAAAARLLAVDRPVALPLLITAPSPDTTSTKTVFAEEYSAQLQLLASSLQQASTTDCSLSASPLPDEVLQQLNALGIVRLAQLQALPFAELSRRFSPTLYLYLQELSGERPAKLTFYQPPESFTAQLELLYQCEYVAQLQGPLTLLLKKLQTYLLQRAQHCYLLELQLQLQHGESLLLSIQSAQGEYQYQRWLALCQLRLEPLKLQAPVTQLGLRALQACVRPEQALALFDRTSSALTPAQLQSLLLAKFGPAQLFRLSTMPAHRPDQANQCLPLLSCKHDALSPYSRQTTSSDAVINANTAGAHRASQKKTATNNAVSGPASSPLGPSGLTFLRPSLLLTAPVPLQEQIQLQAGIERLVSGWWDGKPIERDYQIGRNAQGQWCWLFKDRTGWYLQGYFA